MPAKASSMGVSERKYSPRSAQLPATTMFCSVWVMFTVKFLTGSKQNNW
ncbi:MAG: hypothetical protein AVDCRST_MAG56-1720 [uncultured Cytophagales bacterium]|uniref:Uncharacterized protein n=1 Tax=uncultured Cytophagales bacterium TaxID=158755 RepID=A0A6J4IBY6_9SPHI|nr:MAG: hypothetical protein AVDCRST_MAG56-1720 [uncultured Cytophagales bacterium]